ncbi:MAG: hypothetical protein K0Q50_231 [Vampirovibrio sp.]|jgi:hypothetical protein|nr:hypothetical protein [Vampirovibrio sp.]
MTPTYEDLVKALIVAKEALEKIKTNTKGDFARVASYEVATQALSHIQPLLEEVENGTGRP